MCMCACVLLGWTKLYRQGGNRKDGWHSNVVSSGSEHRKLETNGDRDEISDFQKETMRHSEEEVSGDIVDGEPVFVSDNDKDYSLVFGQTRMTLCNTRC